VSFICIGTIAERHFSLSVSTMPPKDKTLEQCQHSVLTTSPSPYAAASGYSPYSHEQILTAMTGKRKHPLDAVAFNFLPAYPAPLVLPGDCIDVDRKYPPQSFRSWLNETDRNPVTAQRKVIYVTAPPMIDPKANFMRHFRVPTLVRAFPRCFPAGLLTRPDIREASPNDMHRCRRSRGLLGGLLPWS
jgi:hypothetical protein